MTKKEREKAIAKIKDIYEDVVDAKSDLFIDETDIYSMLSSLTRQYDGKLPIVFEID